MEKGKTYGIVAAVIVIVIVVAAAAWYMTQDNGGEDSQTGDTYYFYFDGVEEADGWQEATGSNAQEAYEKVLTDVGLTYTFNQYGMVSMEEYPETYDGATGKGTGFGFYLYTSTDVTQPNKTYFALGPVLADVTGNIIYVTYSTYTMDLETYVNTYDNSPFTNDAWLTSGPFASGSDYKPLEYSDTYSFYLDNIGDNDGWYTVSASSADEALLGILSDLGFQGEFDQYGLLSVDGFEGTWDNNTNSGTGFAVYVYISNDTSMPNASYFTDGPVVGNAAGNIMYISFGSYTMNPVTYDTSYVNNPYDNEESWITTGPFQA